MNDRRNRANTTYVIDHNHNISHTELVEGYFE